MNTKYNILVVDDSTDHRDSISTLLKEMGYEVRQAENGKKALEMIREFPPDLFIVDIEMPEMDGLSFLKEIDIVKNMYEAIIVTGYENLDDAKKAMSLNAFCYLGKPITKETLKEQVNKALEHVEYNRKRFIYLTSLEQSIETRNKELQETMQILENKDVMIDNILNSLDEGLLVIDNDENVVFMNAHSQKIIEISFAECAGQRINKVIKDDDLLHVIKGIIKNGQKPRESFNHIFTKSSKKNDNQYYTIYSSDYYDNAGKIVGKIFNFVNETGKIEFERLKNSLLTVVSHELRTPLNIIMNYISLLKLKKESIENVDEVLNDMEVIGSRLKHQINNVMSIARLSDSSLVPGRDRVNVEHLISLQVEKLRMEASEKNIKVTIKNKVKDPTIITDSKILGIGINSLMSNAIKFNKLNGTVEIEIDKKGANGSSRLIINISDEGIGIDQKEKKQLFEKFVQLEDHMTRHYHGVGIGLFLVKRTMGILHGEVSVSSVVGQGSTFTLEIPMQQGYNTNK